MHARRVSNPRIRPAPIVPPPLSIPVQHAAPSPRRAVSFSASSSSSFSLGGGSGNGLNAAGTSGSSTTIGSRFRNVIATGGARNRPAARRRALVLFGGLLAMALLALSALGHLQARRQNGGSTTDGLSMYQGQGREPGSSGTGDVRRKTVARLKAHGPKAQVAKLAVAEGESRDSASKKYSNVGGKKKKNAHAVQAGDDGAPGIFELTGDATGDYDEDDGLLPAVRHVSSDDGDEDIAAGVKYGWTVHNPKLSQCERTVEYKMAGLHGFGSEFNLLVRAASLARYYSYTLMPVDSAQWNYGSWSSFFEPIVSDCRPPPASTTRVNMLFPSSDSISDRTSPLDLGWIKHPHVKWGRRDVEGLDRTVVNLFTRKDQVNELHRRDLEQLSLAQHRRPGAGKQPEPVPRSLAPSDTVPLAYRTVFKLQSEVARALWRPNAEIRAMVRRVEQDLELGFEQDEEDGPRVRADGAKQAGDLVLGMHVRLGDKYMEASRIGPQAYAKDLVPEPSSPAVAPGLHAELVAAYLEAAIHTVTDILLDSTGTVKAWNGQPTLVIMSDDPSAWQTFTRHPLGQRFRILGTPPAVKEDPVDKKRFKRSLKSGQKADDGGFNERTFNAMGLDERVTLTKTFVRDISLFVKHCDGLVLTASSNVGRLLLLLAGEEMAYTRVRSLDTRWFPTASFF